MADQTCKKISREMLKPGDHICTDRWKGLFYHHGIYVGNDLVIHLSGPRTGSGASGLTKMKSSSSAAKFCTHEKCQNNGSNIGPGGGTIRTCLDCFLDGHSLSVYDYECSVVCKYVEESGGCIKPPNEVVDSAYHGMQGDMWYHLLGSNCEHFATLCKTGLPFSMQSIIFMDKLDAARHWMVNIPASFIRKSA